MSKMQQIGNGQGVQTGNGDHHCSCGMEGFATSYALLHSYCRCAERENENECGFFPLSTSHQYVKIAKISMGTHHVI